MFVRKKKIDLNKIYKYMDKLYVTRREVILQGTKFYTLYAGGYLLSYSIFNGSQYEGYTMIPIIDVFIRRFSLKEFVIAVDTSLMSKTLIPQAYN